MASSRLESEEPKQEQSREEESGGIPVNKKKMKVLVAIDESEGSFYALTWALDHLFPSSSPSDQQAQKRTTLILLHVQQPFQQYIFPAGPAVYATSAVVESVRKSQQQNSSLLIARALEACKGKTIEIETLILDGDPKDMICQVAEQHHVVLVVVGSRGLGTIKRAFLGSVSDYCAHHAKCPILIVKPPK